MAWFLISGIFGIRIKIRHLISASTFATFATLLAVPVASGQIVTNNTPYQCTGSAEFSRTHNASLDVTLRSLSCIAPTSLAHWYDLSADPELAGAYVTLTCADFSVWSSESSVDETLFIRVYLDTTPLDGPDLASQVFLGEETIIVTPSAEGVGSGTPGRTDGDRSVQFVSDYPDGIVLPPDAAFFVEVGYASTARIRFGCNLLGEAGDALATSEVSWIKSPACGPSGWNMLGDFFGGTNGDRDFVLQLHLNAFDCQAAGTPAGRLADLGLDCNGNGILDVCDLISGFSADCDGNDVLDECDISQGTHLDCDLNGQPDLCDIAQGEPDCNQNSIPDACELAAGSVPDCNANGVPDSCDIARGDDIFDCNLNAIPDECDIAAGANDCNLDGVPDECDADCNTNGLFDACEIADGLVPDCNRNGVPDSCDLTSGFSVDCNTDGVPDECGDDCNYNGVADTCDINPADPDGDGNVSVDVNGNGVPDECEDCNKNGILDPVEVAAGASDCNGNLVPDECEYSVRYRSKPISPVIEDLAFSWIIELPPESIGVVMVSAVANADYGNVPSFLVTINGDDTATLLTPLQLPPDCSGSPVLFTGAVDTARFNREARSGVLNISITPRSVREFECPDSFMAFTIEYQHIAGDCNLDGVPDVCEIAANSDLDCNSDGILDICTPDHVYLRDDGVLDARIGGFMSGGADVWWANQYTVEAGHEFVSGVDIMWEELADYGNGVPTTVLIYDDPNNDGDPDDAVLLAATETVSSMVESGIYVTVPIGPVRVGDAGEIFFVAAMTTHGDDVHPIPMVISPDQDDHSWFMQLDPGTMDPNDTSNAFSLDDQFFGPQHMMLRAISGDCNANGIEDACDISGGSSFDDDANNVPDECEPRTGDTNGDDVVGIIDFLAILSNWGPCLAPCPYDTNADGLVGIVDFLAVLANWD